MPVGKPWPPSNPQSHHSVQRLVMELTPLGVSITGHCRRSVRPVGQHDLCRRGERRDLERQALPPGYATVLCRLASD